MSTNTVMTISIMVMILGLGICAGVFKTLGPITTDKGMNRLGIAVIVIGVIIGLTQSTPT